ncbi:MAG: flagellar biosynthetic protein FliO [Phycisphaerales bacterium]
MSQWLCKLMFAVVAGAGWVVSLPVNAAEPDSRRPLGQPMQEAAPLGASPGEVGSTGLGETLAALALVIGLVVVCAAAYRWLASRSGSLGGGLAAARSPAGLLDVLGRYPIGRGQALLLLRLDRRVLLVSQTAGARVGSAPGLRTLAEIADPDEVAAIVAKASPAEGRFSESFARASGVDRSPFAPAGQSGVEVVDLTRGPGIRGRFGAWLGGAR